MIRAMVFLDRGGITPPEEWEVLGRIDITNNLTMTLKSDGKRGTYDCVVYKKSRQPWRRFKLRDFPRESYHPWEMVRRILNGLAEQNGGRI